MSFADTVDTWFSFLFSTLHVHSDINFDSESHPCFSKPLHISFPLCSSRGLSIVTVAAFEEGRVRERLKLKHCPSFLFVHSHTLLCQFHAGPPAGRTTLLLSPLLLGHEELPVIFTFARCLRLHLCHPSLFVQCALCMQVSTVISRSFLLLEMESSGFLKCSTAMTCSLVIKFSH